MKRFISGLATVALATSLGTAAFAAQGSTGTMSGMATPSPKATAKAMTGKATPKPKSTTKPHAMGTAKPMMGSPAPMATAKGK